MITFRAGRTALWLVLAGLVACSAEQQDWRSAEAAGTSEAYQRFLDQHPASELAAKARERVGEFAEERDWTQATRLATSDAYRGFLSAHPAGRWAQEARIRIESFALGSIPRMQPSMPGQTASRPTGVNILRLASAPHANAAPPAAANAQPPAANARTPASPGAMGGRYAVQLGAFGTQASADKEWQRLQSRFSSQLSGLSPQVISAGTSAGQLYRLQAGASGEQQARAICDSLKAQSQPCVPVAPR